MAEARASKLPAHDSKKVPDPSPNCPRCHYWEQKLAAEAPGRPIASRYPNGIDQQVAVDILNRAFPQKQRNYG